MIKKSIWLFLINIFIGAFTFGGGYVVVPMIEKYYITNKNLFSTSELHEMAAIAQLSPGAIAINLCVLAGQKVLGKLGIVISFISSLIPSIVILSIVAHYYNSFITNVLINNALRAMQATVAAMIIILVYDMVKLLLKDVPLSLIILIPLAFILNFILNVNPIVIILLSIVYALSILIYETRSNKVC